MRQVLLATIGLTLLAVGCGKEEAPPPSTGLSLPSTPPGMPAGPSRYTQEELDAVTMPEKQYRIALIVKTRNNPFFDPMIKAAEAEAKALNAAIDVQAPAQETDKERQFALVQDVIARGVDAVLIAPADSKGIVPALKQGQDKNVLIVNLDNRVDTASATQAGLNLAAYVGADNRDGGKLAGEAMSAALGDGGKVVVIEGIRGADNAEARKKGFEEGSAGKLEIMASDTAEWDTQKAYAKLQPMLAKYPDIQGVFCANDKMALGALKAIAEAGKSGKVRVVGYDNIADVKAYLERGEMLATIEQHPDLMGKYGVRAAVGLLSGKLKPGGEFLVPLEVIKSKAAPH